MFSLKVCLLSVYLRNHKKSCFIQQNYTSCMDSVLGFQFEPEIPSNELSDDSC